MYINVNTQLFNGAQRKVFVCIQNTVKLVYNDIGLFDTSFITSDILWYQIPRRFPRRLQQHPFITTQNIQFLSWLNRVWLYFNENLLLPMALI